MPTVSQVIESLRKKRDELSRRVTSLDEAIRVLGALKEDFGPDDINLPDDFVATHFGEEPARARANRVRPADVADSVAEILREAGRPMTRGEIADALSGRGIVLAGKDVNKNVGTILWRHQERFVNLEKLGYWLRDLPLPGVYLPPML